jgi:hypothetical protein
VYRIGNPRSRNAFKCFQEQDTRQLPESGDESIYGHLNALFFTETWNLTSPRNCFNALRAKKMEIIGMFLLRGNR